MKLIYIKIRYILNLFLRKELKFRNFVTVILYFIYGLFYVDLTLNIYMTITLKKVRNLFVCTIPFGL